MAPPTEEDAFKWVAAVRAQMLGMSDANKIAFVQAQLATWPDPPRSQYSLFFVLGAELNREQKKNRTFLVVAFVVLFAYIGAIPFLVASPTPPQMFIFRLIASLFAGVAGAFIPGSLDLKGKAGGFAIKGTSAFALAILVYLVNPPAIVTH